MRIRNTTLAVLSDMHVGSSTALFPAGGYWGEHNEDNPVLPNPKQKMIHGVFSRLCGEVANARKDRDLIIVLLGDLVDGFHHGSMQESLFKQDDQIAACIQVIEEFKKGVGFGKNDRLYITRGTEVHVKDVEKEIGKKIKAVKSDSGIHVHEVLELNINGSQHIFFHHGKARGAGANEGNELRNYIRNITIERRKERLTPPDVFWSGHTHGHTWSTWNERQEDGRFRLVHGIVCPSFQAKTIYVYGKAALAVNSVGGVYVNIGVDGSMGIPQFVVRKTIDN